MPQTLQPKALRGAVVLILVVGTLSLPQIGNFFAPAVTRVGHGSTRLDEHGADPLRKRDAEKVVAQRFSGDTEDPCSSGARYPATPMPRDVSSARYAGTAIYTAPTNRLQVEEQDPTLEEEILSLEEQYAQEQYLQEVAALEEMLQREFDPTATTPHLTAEQVAAVEEEIQEKILQEESLQPMLQDLQPDGYGVESTPPEH